MSALFSIVLRCALLGIRFSFVLFFAKYSSVENVGTYALFVSCITIFVFIFGFEMHSSACRELTTKSTYKARSFIFTNHSVFVFFISFLLVSIYVILANFHFNQFYSWLSINAVLLVCCELYSQELSRYLLMLERPIASNFLQLIRSGLWAIPALFLLRTSPENKHIDIIINAWLFADVIAIFFAILMLKSSIFFKKELDIKWIKKTLVRSRSYWFVAILAQLQMYVDRFILNYYEGQEIVGVLGVYQSFTGVVQTFIQVGVISIILPKLIKFYSHSDFKAYKSQLRKMVRQTFAYSLLLSLGMVLLIIPVLQLIDKEQYISHINCFYIQMISQFVLTIALVPHMVLYAAKADRLLLKIAIYSFPVYFFLAVLLTKNYGIMGAVIAALINNLLLLYIKAKKAKHVILEI